MILYGLCGPTALNCGSRQPLSNNHDTPASLSPHQDHASHSAFGVYPELNREQGLKGLIGSLQLMQDDLGTIMSPARPCRITSLSRSRNIVCITSGFKVALCVGLSMAEAPRTQLCREAPKFYLLQQLVNLPSGRFGLHLEQDDPSASGKASNGWNAPHSRQPEAKLYQPPVSGV